MIQPDIDPTTERRLTDASTSPVQRLADSMLQRIGAEIDVRRVFGEPVTRGNQTIVPVAAVRTAFGFGGGSGSGEGQQGEGGGGGGAVGVRPLGYLEVGDTSTRFVPIRDPSRFMLVVAIAVAIAGLMILRRLLQRS